MVNHKYSQEEKEFLKEFVPGHSHKEIMEAFNNKFEYQITVSQVKGCIARYKLNTGRTGRFVKGNIPYNKGIHTETRGRMAETQYKKGNLPHNTKPIGYERVTKDGYTEVKVALRPSKPSCNDNFVLKHRLIFEKINGPIPDGHIVIFKDGNKQNFDPSNLAVISHAENVTMLRRKLRKSKKELTETGILIAQAEIAVRNKVKQIQKERHSSF